MKKTKAMTRLATKHRHRHRQIPIPTSPDTDISVTRHWYRRYQAPVSALPDTDNERPLPIRRIDNPHLTAYLIDNLQRDQGVLMTINPGLPLARQDEVDKFRYLIIVLILIGDHT